MVARTDSHEISSDGADNVTGSARASRAVWFFVSGTVLALIVPVLLVVQVSNDGRSGAWWVTLLICTWSGFRLAWIIGRGRPALFEFFFWLYVYVFFGLAATVQFRSGDFSSTTPGMSPAVEFPTALLIAGSLVAFEFGRLVVRGRSSAAPAMVSHPRGIKPGATWLLLVLGLLFMAFYVSKLGVASFFQSRDTRATARSDSFSDASTGAVVEALSWIPLLVAAGAFAWRRRARKAVGLSGRFGLVALAAAACVLVVVNPISGARFTSGTVLFALVSYTGIFRSVRRVRFALAGLVFAFLFLFPIADAFRGATVKVSRGGFFLEYAGNPDYDSVWQIANSVTYVTIRSITWGGQFIGVILFWVPRSIWAAKPTDTGILLANFRGYTVTNLSAPIWAEAVTNGGRTFAVIVLAGMGYLFLKLDRRLGVSLLSGGVGAVAGAIFPAYMIILLRGSLLQASGGFFVMAGSLLLIGSGGKQLPATELVKRGVLPDLAVSNQPDQPAGLSSAEASLPAPIVGARHKRTHDGPIRAGFLLDSLQFREPFNGKGRKGEQLDTAENAVEDKEPCLSAKKQKYDAKDSVIDGQ